MLLLWIVVLHTVHNERGLCPVGVRVCVGVRGGPLGPKNPISHNYPVQEVRVPCGEMQLASAVSRALVTTRCSRPGPHHRRRPSGLRPQTHRRSASVVAVDGHALDWMQDGWRALDLRV